MPDTPLTPCCPHCGSPLKAFQLPENTGWDSPIHFACFNDECPYFRRGWAWMLEHYGVKSSYRYRVDPDTGRESPLAVWSEDAVKDRILDAEIIAGRAGDDPSPEKTGDREPATAKRETAARAGRKARATNAAGAAKQNREAVRKPAGKGKKA